MDCHWGKASQKTEGRPTCCSIQVITDQGTHFTARSTAGTIEDAVCWLVCTLLIGDHFCIVQNHLPREWMVPPAVDHAFLPIKTHSHTGLSIWSRQFLEWVFPLRCLSAMSSWQLQLTKPNLFQFQIKEFEESIIAQFPENLEKPKQRSEVWGSNPGPHGL